MKLYLASIIILLSNITLAQSSYQSLSEYQDVFNDELYFIYVTMLNEGISEMNISIDGFNSEVSKNKGKNFIEKMKVQMINDSLMFHQLYSKAYYTVYSNNTFYHSDSTGQINFRPTELRPNQTEIIKDSSELLIIDSHNIYENDTIYHHVIINKTKVMGSTVSNYYSYKFQNGIKVKTGGFSVKSNLENNRKTVEIKSTKYDSIGNVESENITIEKSFLEFNKKNQLIKIKKQVYLQEDKDLSMYLYESHIMKMKYK
jgi:hypothetical protein